MPHRFITKTEVAERTGLHPVTIWRLEKNDNFPARRQISKNRVAYLESEVDAWMASRGQDYNESPNPKAKGEAA